MTEHFGELVEFAYRENQVEELQEFFLINRQDATRYEGDKVSLIFLAVPPVDPGVYLIDRFLPDRAGDNAQQGGFIFILRPGEAHAVNDRPHPLRIGEVHLATECYYMIVH